MKRFLKSELVKGQGSDLALLSLIFLSPDSFHGSNNPLLKKQN